MRTREIEKARQQKDGDHQREGRRMREESLRVPNNNNNFTVHRFGGFSFQGRSGLNFKSCHDYYVDY